MIQRPLHRMLSPHFSAWEMRCRCGRVVCDAKPMRDDFMARLERLRVAWGKPLDPVSAARCTWHNAKVGGAVRSEHLNANAVDFWFDDPAEKRAFVALAIELGFGGIGVGRHSGKVHIDGRPLRESGKPVRWEYE